MTVTFAADGSSYQSLIDWHATKAAGFGAGTEKVTQGLGYINPYWPASRAALHAAAGPGFVPGAYHYLTAGDGAGQADFFATHAGAIPGFVIWCDLERAPGTSPAVADARAFVSRLRVHYPGKRIGLYAGQSFTGSESLTFADMLWSPRYVAGEGTPAELYKEVPGSWWAPYGGLVPVLLQFSQSAAVPGVDALADVSAYRGSAAQMHAALLGTPKPLPPRKDAPMLIKRGAGATTPLALTEGTGQIVLLAETTATVVVQVHNHGDTQCALTWQPGGIKVVDIPAGVQGVLLHRVDDGAGDVAVTTQ